MCMLDIFDDKTSPARWPGCSLSIVTAGRPAWPWLDVRCAITLAPEALDVGGGEGKDAVAHAPDMELTEGR